MYTAANNDKVDRLVLYAPLYSDEEPEWVAQMAAPGNLEQMKDVGAYRTVKGPEPARTATVPATVGRVT